MSIFWRSKKKDSSRPGSVVITENNGGSMFATSKEKKQNDDNPKIVEAQFGESLGLRTRSLKKMAYDGSLGLGLPDMVHVAHYDSSRKDEVGEYHYVTGIDCSSEVMPIAYLSTLRLSQRLGKESICTFCSVNIFSHIDLRIKFENEKMYDITAVDCKSDNVHVPMDDKLWKELFLSAMIRSVIFNKDREWKLPGMVELPIGIDNGMGYAESIIEMLCEFIPRYKETGTDLTKTTAISPLHNYLTETLISYLSLTPKLHEYCITILDKLSKVDKANEVLYQIVKCKVAFNSNSLDLITISCISETLAKFFNNAFRLKKTQLTVFADLLNLQVEFLIKKKDYELALIIALKSTKLVPDNFYSWYFLAQSYISLGQYNSALLAINSTPKLLSVDPNKEVYWMLGLDRLYYKKPQGQVAETSLNSHEYHQALTKFTNANERDMDSITFGRIIMPANTIGYMKNIFEGAALNIGPVYGPQSLNLIDYVSREEVGAVSYISLLERNSQKNVLPWYMHKIYGLLMSIVKKCSWNGLLELRSSIFVMESEHSVVQQGTLLQIRKKRMCEKWLDRLFMQIYQDLKVSLNSPALKDSKSSGLEWELLGILLAKTEDWSEAVACLRTSIMARFDVLAAEKLLKLYLYKEMDFPLTTDDLLLILIEKCAYDARFYDTFQSLNLRVLYELAAILGAQTLRNRIYAQPQAERGIVNLMDKLMDWVQQFAA